MRRFGWLVGAMLLIIGATGWYASRKPKDVSLVDYFKQLPDYLRTQTTTALQQIHLPAAASTSTPTVARPAGAPTTTTPVLAAKVPMTTRPRPKQIPNFATIYLTNGGSMNGQLVEDTAEHVTLRADYGDVGFRREEIARLVKGGTVPEQDISLPWQGKPQWSYQHDIVVRLMKGTIVDGKITMVTPQEVMVTQEVPGGGRIEQTLRRTEIDQLLFRPRPTPRAEQIEARLRQLFPKMQWYEEGMFTIVTDAPGPTVKQYRQTIRELATDWYLTFFSLAQGRTPTVQQYVVVFDDWADYIEYAATDGVPGWLAVGYFDPQQEVLYCFNMLGDRFSELLEEAYLGDARTWRDRLSQQVKESREAVFIEGQLSELLQKFETAHSTIRQIYGQLSVDVLRHELTHAMFHNWQLQTVVLSKLPAADPDEIKKKQQFLKTEDAHQKRQLLEEILNRQKQQELPQLQADNSWFSEGLAGYMEPSTVGGLNVERVAEVKEARRAGRLLPFEFLNTFRMGSFPGITTQSQLYAYAQSWALCHFLMQRYPDRFLVFQDHLARERPKNQDEELRWFVDAMGTDQRALEAEFFQYVDSLPEQDSFRMQQIQVFLTLLKDLEFLESRL